MSGQSNVHGAHPWASSMNARFSPTRGLARRARTPIVSCATAALALAWWVSLDTRRSVGMTESHRESPGRGGSFCPGATADNPAPVVVSAPAVECQNVSRGGLLYPERPRP